MTVLIDVQSLVVQERALVGQLRRLTEEGGYADLLRRVFETRVELGAACEEEAKEAELDGTPWSEWCGRLPFSQPQADKYRRVYHARVDVERLTRSGTLPYNLDQAVLVLPTQAQAKQLAYATGGGATGGNNATPKRDPNDWQTPAKYIEAARRVMGSIDFDPFSSDWANQRVQATQFYDEETDAFQTPWPLDRREIGARPGARANTVWMNPPYGRNLIQKAVEVFLGNLPRIDHAIVLVNNATDTSWAHQLNAHCTAKVETAGRIQFERPEHADKVVSSNTRGQVFYYFGDNMRGFFDAFRPFGFCWVPCENCTDG